MKTRQEILDGLAAQYKKEFSDQGYPKDFIPQLFLTQCNYGGLLLIKGNAGDSVIVWGDWADGAIDETLTQSEIEFIEDEDNGLDLVPAIKYGESYFKYELFSSCN
jgi:hypothetical protein